MDSTAALPPDEQPLYFRQAAVEDDSSSRQACRLGLRLPVAARVGEERIGAGEW